jgi:Ku protein
MKDKGRVALARIVFANREHIIAVEPWDKGMLATTLRYDHEVRDEKQFFKDIPKPRIDKEMIELASDILDRKAGHFDAAKFKDEYELALRKLVKRKASGKTIEVSEAPERPSNVIDLMDALQKSLGKKGGSGPTKRNPRRTKSGRRRKSA